MDAVRRAFSAVHAPSPHRAEQRACDLTVDPADAAEVCTVCAPRRTVRARLRTVWGHAKPTDLLVCSLARAVLKREVRRDPCRSTIWPW